VKDKILFGLFIVLAFFVGFTLGGIGKSDTDDADALQVTANTSPSDQVMLSVSKVLDPFLADYEQRYTDLNEERVALRAELSMVKQELATVKASGETVSVLKSQATQQQSEMGSLRVSLQDAVNDSASWQQKFQQSQYAASEAQRLLAVSQGEYSDLCSKLSVVDNRESDTVNGFTVEEKAVFYKVWDAWWGLVVIGTD
jgi:hypothetical protein